MKLKQSIRYQLADYKAGILVYYCAVVALYVVMYLVHIFLSRNVLYLNGGISAFSAIFLFICGLCSLHDNLPMHLQNGVSRKTMLLGRLVVTVMVGAFCALIDTLLALVIDFSPIGLKVNAATASASLLRTTYSFWPYMHVGGILLDFFFNFFLLLLASSLGYFIIVFFYRLPVKLRIVVGACAGFLLFFGVPGLQLVNDALGYPFSYIAEHYLWPLEDAIVASPLLTMGTWAVAAVVLATVTWLILRRTTVAR